MKPTRITERHRGGIAALRIGSPCGLASSILLAGAALAAAVLPGGAAAAAVIHVPADQPTIQAGIDAAQPGDTVLVAAGTYTGSGNWDLDFGGKGITVVSEDGAATCIIDLREEDGHHRGFYFHSGEGPASVVEGFTIRHGWAEKGGAIYCLGASPTIRNNILGDNGAGWGGGICCENASPLIQGNLIVENSQAGIACLQGSSPVIQSNTIFRNTGWGSGGGIACLASPATITGNVIRWNHTLEYMAYEGGYASGVGAGIYYEGSGSISGNLIEENGGERCDHGGGICFSGSPTISGNTITGNYALAGAGIYGSGSPLITGNVIQGNTADYYGSGAGVWVDSGAGLARITHNRITDNGSEWIVTSGAGIRCLGTTWISNNLISGNDCGTEGDYSYWGGGIAASGTATIRNCTIAGNSGGGEGGGIFCSAGSTLVVENTILWDNVAEAGSAIYLTGSASSLTIRYSDVQGGQAGVALVGGSTMSWGAGMLDADPLFSAGPLADYYLGQTGAGQPADSPCVNAGSAAAGSLCYSAHSGTLCMSELTTRTDGVSDQGIVDLGAHFPAGAGEPETIITFSPEGETVDSPVANFAFTGSDDVDPPSALVYSWRLDGSSWSAYSGATLATVPLEGLTEGWHVFGVRARDTAGHVDSTPDASSFYTREWSSDGNWDHLVTGPGPGPFNPPLVRTSQAQWLAYGVARYGVNVACGELDGTGLDEVVTGPGPGGIFGPHVRGWRLNGTPLAGVSFLAYGTHRYGVNVACGDLDGDGIDEIVTGAGHGPVFGAHVRGWNVDGGAAAAIPGVSFLAYGTQRYGVNVACGDVDGDGIDEMITGPGPSPLFGAHVRGWNWDGGDSVTPLPGLSFFAYGTSRYGVNVACGEMDLDGREEILTGPGPGPNAQPRVRSWDYDDGQVTLGGVDFSISPYITSYGVVLAAGEIESGGRDEIWTVLGAGPYHRAEVMAWRVIETGVERTLVFGAYDYWMTHGGRIAGGHLE